MVAKMKQENSPPLNLQEIPTHANTTTHSRHHTPSTESSVTLKDEPSSPDTLCADELETQSSPHFQRTEPIVAINEYHERFETTPSLNSLADAGREEEALSSGQGSSTVSLESSESDDCVIRQPVKIPGLTDDLYIRARQHSPEEKLRRQRLASKKKRSTEVPSKADHNQQKRQSTTYEIDTDDEESVDWEHSSVPLSSRASTMVSGCNNSPAAMNRMRAFLTHQSSDLEEEHELQAAIQRSLVSHRIPVRSLEEADILATYGPATRRLLLFDYDGTLTDIVENPEKAIIPEVLYGWLQTLAMEPKNCVWIISGRDQSFMQRRLGKLTNVGLVAEHGAFIRRPRSEKWENLATLADMSWQPIVKKHFSAFEKSHPGASIQEKKVAIVLHWRGTREEILTTADAAACKRSLEKALMGCPVEIINGKCVLEARPLGVNKGRIVQWILDDLRHNNGPDFVLCMGDDVTDEDMFNALQMSNLPKDTIFTVTIGDEMKSSDADYYIEEPTLVFATIKMLNDCDATGDVEGLGPRQANGKYRGSRVFPVPRSYLIL